MLASIHTHDVDFADLYFQYSRIESWSLEEGIVKSGAFKIDRGVGVRAVMRDKQAFAYSDDIALAALDEAAHAARAIGRQGQSQSRRDRARRRRARAVRSAGSGTLAAEDAKVALLERLERMARARDPRVTQVMASLAGEYEAMLIARSDGLVAADVRPLVRVSLTVIVEENGRREQGYDGRRRPLRLRLLQRRRARALREEGGRPGAAQSRARARRPAGTMTVVLGHGWPGILLHEAIGHGLEGDFNRKGTSAFSGRVGQRVAAQGITVVDDGTIDASPRLAQHRRRRQSDAAHGADRGRHPQGLHAGPAQRRADGRRPDGQRPARVVRLPADAADDEHDHARRRRTIRRRSSRRSNEGIYAVNFGGGQVDITSGKFVFSAAEAWKIEDGKLAYPVKGATLIGNGPDALTKVSMVGHDLAMDSGSAPAARTGRACRSAWASRR